MDWTLTRNAAESQTLAQWGIQNLRAQFTSQGVDQASFDIPVETIETNTAFNFGDTIQITDPTGVQWFYGTVIQTPLTALPHAETHGYVIAGPAWHLEENTFKQPWLTLGTTTKFTGHLLLNVGSNGGLVTIAEQIEAILDYALSLFPAGSKPFQKGTIEGDPFPPITEINGYTCAAALRAQLRWTPEAVWWYDYATSPPTMHVRARAGLPAVSLSVPNRDQVSIVPRYDLQRPSVHIQYEVISDVNGRSYLNVIDDVYPTDKTGQEPRALSVPINLAGSTTVITTAELLTTLIEENSVAWWRLHNETLRDPRISAIAVVETNRKYIDDDGELQDAPMAEGGGFLYPAELIEGQITDWMPFGWHQQIVNAVLSYTVYDRPATEAGAVVVETKTADLVSVNLVATDAPSDVYQNVTTTDTGDPLPLNLAQYLYEQLSELHYDGTIRLVEQEPTGAAKIGQVLNITEGRAEWSTMRGLIQSVAVDVDRGETTVTIGPPNQLGPADLMELLRVGRRSRWTPAATPSTGEMGSAGRLSLGQPTANTNSHNNAPVRSLFAVKSTDSLCKLRPDQISLENELSGASSGTSQVSIAVPDLAAVDEASLPAKFRATIVCVIENGTKVEKTAYVLMTAPQ